MRLAFDFGRGEALVDRRRILLTPMEASVFGVLLKADRPMSTAELAYKVYGGQEPASSHTCIHAFVRSMKRKGIPITHRTGYGYEVRR